MNDKNLIKNRNSIQFYLLVYIRYIIGRYIIKK